MFKPHPDDLRERDVAWLRGPTPSLPRRTVWDKYIGFDGNGWKAVSGDPLYEWAAEAQMCIDERLDLVLTWPEDGGDLQPYIDQLARALDVSLGIVGRLAEPKPAEANTPAVSNPERGKCANPDCAKPAMPHRTHCNGPCRTAEEMRHLGSFIVRPFRWVCGGSWNQRAEPDQILICHRKGCARRAHADWSSFQNRYLDNPKRREHLDNPKRREQLVALQERSRNIERRFARRGFTTEPATKLLGGKEHMAVRILNHTGPTKPGMNGSKAMLGAVWTLTKAEEWLDKRPPIDQAPIRPRDR